MLSVLMNLGFAASGSSSPATPTREVGAQGTYLLLGAGCYLLPILATLLVAVR